MRGLNKCFILAVQELNQRNPAVDFTRLFEQYQKHLASFTPATEALGSSTKPSIDSKRPAAFNRPVLAEPKLSEERQPVAFTFQAPRPVESLPQPALSAEAAKADLFIDPAKNPTVNPVDTKEAIAPPTFSFGNLNEASVKSPSFGAVKEEMPSLAPKPSTFGTEPVKAAPSEATRPFSFGVGPIDEPKSEAKLAKPLFSFAADPPSKLEETSTTTIEKPALFSFSLPKNEAAASTIGVEMSPAPTKPFNFSLGAGAVGLTPDKPALPAFSFGAAPINNGAFSFAFPQPTQAVVSDNEDDEDGIPAEEQESFSLTRNTSEALKTGAGEENEATVHEQRCKVFLSDREKGWIDLGVVVFKVNRDQRPDAAGQSRILCRAEGSGRIVLNARITAIGTEATPLPGKKEVALLVFGGADGKPQKYLIRVKTLEEAGHLHKAIQDEVSYVQENKK